MRWKAWVHVGLSGLLAVGGLALAWRTSQLLPGLLMALVGAVAVHIAQLPLTEPDVLLRLTPEAVWTKELGWQNWANVLVYIEKAGRGSAGSGSHLVVHRPGEATPRFFESVHMLDIDPAELRRWLKQYASGAAAG